MSNVFSSLILAVTGGILTMTGSLVTSRVQSKNSSNMRQEQYLREDRYRLFDKRLEAYANLYIAIGAVRVALFQLSHGPESEETSEQARIARAQYWTSYTIVRLIGSDEVYEIANRMLAWIDESIRHASFERTQFISMLNEFTDAARAELIPRIRG